MYRTGSGAQWAAATSRRCWMAHRPRWVLAL